MKKAAFIFFFLCFGLISHAQKLNLTIVGETETDNIIINKIGYQKEHPNAKSIVEEINLTSNNLTKIGYIENKVLENKKTTDSTFVCKLFLGNKIDSIRISLANNSTLKSLSLFEENKDTITLPYPEVEDFMKLTLAKLEMKGYALAKLKLINIKKQNNILIADLDISIEKQRQVNDIVIKGYEKFPVGFKLNIKRLYKNEIFNQDNLNKVYKDFEKIRFVKQVKYPEILFEKDSTKIYVYLEKIKSNSFDGFIGFANDTDKKITFNGFLDLNLSNTINSGELFTLFWRSDGNDQKVFNIAFEIPYIFKSPLGIKANLNIFKQDSTFQNTKTAINIGYLLRYNSRLYLGYQSTESSDIQNANSTNLSDYTNYFITGNYEFFEFKNDDILFPVKTNANLTLGYGNRESNINTSNQIFAKVDLDHNFYFNKKNCFNLRSQNYYLKSDDYLVNELYRFGGIYSIQGFKENSLQGNLFASILTEYRYIITPTIYIHSIIDYGYFQDKSTNNQGNLFGLGLGFGLLTKNGILNLAYATGSSNDQAIVLANSIVHFSFRTKF